MRLILTILICMVIGTFGYSQQTVGLFQNDSTALNSYTLIAPLNSTQTYVIDNCGFVVNAWNNSAYEPAASVYLLEDGSIMRTCNIGDTTLSTGGSGGRLEQYDWDDNLIWSYNVSDGIERQHHDIAVLPNGNVLVLAFDLKTNAEALAAGRNPNMLNSVIWSEKIIELQPIGVDSAVTVWEWTLWEHLIQDIDPNLSNFGSIRNHPELIDLNHVGLEGGGEDWIHANALDYNPTLDQIMISARNYHELWVIDHSTTTAEAASHTGGNSGKGGDILYRWGNPKTYGIGSDDDQMLFGQHHPHWITDGLRDGGKIMVYNNGLNNPLLVSRVQIIDPPVDAAGNYAYQTDSMFLPHAPSWTYQTPLFSDFVSGAERLENGNTLICDGPLGTLTEIDSFDNVVWKYVSPAESNGAITTQNNMPNGNTLFRANKYTPEYSAFTGRDLTPSSPIEINPIMSNCAIYYPTATISIWKPLEIKIIGNPIENVLKMENLNQENIQLKVVDLLGRVVLEVETNDSFLEYDTSSWANGTYFIIAMNNNKQVFRTQIVKL